jgi:hypothetical protein
MPFDRNVCLANSYKHDHRCVAGINLTTRKWVRLIGNKIPGCLTADETCYADGREVALLDVFEAEIGDSMGSACHPEDVKVGTTRWRPVRRFDNAADAHFLASKLTKGPIVLQGAGDRVYARKVESSPVEHSLELVRPGDLWWWIRDEDGKRKNRALFRAGSVTRARYDLAVTDPAWLGKLHSLAPGIYPHAQVSTAKSTKTILTVSLSERFEGFHWKIVAGVIESIG